MSVKVMCKDLEKVFKFISLLFIIIIMIKKGG